MNCSILLAGFGGQGILSAGRFIASAALTEGKEVCWFPSYGPEMRGGTANCGVIVSDKTIGSPFITEADALVAMNSPSLEKFSEICQARWLDHYRQYLGQTDSHSNRCPMDFDSRIGAGRRTGQHRLCDNHPFGLSDPPDRPGWTRIIFPSFIRKSTPAPPPFDSG